MIFLEKLETKLSIAVLLLDNYSGQTPIGNLNVSLKDKEEKPIKNLSSFYVFTDLPLNTYHIQVKGDYYFDGDLTVDTNQLDNENPLVISLTPNNTYPFPADATLIRGMLWDSDDLQTRKVLVNSDVSGLCSAINLKLNVKTNENGEFVFYFNPFNTQNKVVNNQVFTISAGTAKEECTIIESKTQTMDIPKLK